MGLRYRVDFAPLPGLRRRADLVFTRQRLAVFVDGCFWHSCPAHLVLPKANADWWQTKLARTRERDRETDKYLALAGWTVVRVWEHEPSTEAASRVQHAVRGGPAPGSSAQRVFVREGREPGAVKRPRMQENRVSP
jgi:DNA mismatch endonuclease (patch repair protein)